MISLPAEARPLARKVKALVLDVDGVLTDGQLRYGPDGEYLKVFHVHDGLGIRLLMEQGIEIAVITARDTPALHQRTRDLGIERVYSGRRDKLTALLELQRELGLQDSQLAFVGDDALDVPVMRQVGLPISVANGHWSARQAARWVTERKGGMGAVREVADGLLEGLGLLDAAYAGWLSNVTPD